MFHKRPQTSFCDFFYILTDSKFQIYKIDVRCFTGDVKLV